MSDNPYEAPPESIPVIGVNSGRLEDVRNVAVYQKGVLFSVLLNVIMCVALLLAGRGMIPPIPPFVMWLAFIAMGVAGFVFTVGLSLKVYHTGVGILLGLLCLIPLINLLVLLSINSKATTILRANGHQVGFMGADLSKF